MSPLLVISFIILFVIRLLLLIPSTANRLPLLYNAGFLVGISSLFAPPAILFLLLIWIALIIHRSNHWRNYAVSLTGTLTPLVLMATWYFWNGQLTEAGENLINQFHLPDFATLSLAFNTDFLLLALLFVIAIVAGLRSFAQLREKNINLRQNLIVVYYYFIIAAVVFLLSGDKYYLILLVIPSVLIIVHFQKNAAQKKIYDIIAIVFILLIIVNQYLRLPAFN